MNSILLLYFIIEVVEKLTYTFMYLSPDADKGVGQSAGVALLLGLRRGVVTEHSLHVETQHETQQTALLTVLIETQQGQITAAVNTHIRSLKPLSVCG